MPRRMWVSLTTSIVLLPIMLLAGMVIMTVQAQGSQDEATRTRELAERLLLQSFGGPYYPFGGPDAEPPRVQLLVGQLAPELPSEIALPPGGRLLGSLIRSGGFPGPSGASVEVVVDAPGAPAAIQQFYEAAMVERGWSTPPQMPAGPPSMGGFQAQLQSATYLTFCQPEERGYLNLSLRPLNQGMVDVRLSWFVPRDEPSAAPFLAPSYFTPCSMPERTGPPGRPPFPDNPIPRLVPPTDTRLLPMGQSGGPGTWNSEAMAETDLAAATLEAHFGQQLAEAGWVRTEGTVSGPLAWSSWQFTLNETEWYGLLLVAELPTERRRTLSVRVYSPSVGVGPTWTMGG
jgi:hypothetical protein